MEWSNADGTVRVWVEDDELVMLSAWGPRDGTAPLTPEQASDLASALLRANQEILGPRPSISDDVVAAIHEYVRNNRTDPGHTK